ncbi:uncharacterized protein FIESC28_03807 [Fusarium coffeatum]|uniref:NmrA-like domain-containing protein n=1 Tax=Fusarium coffeatum TaxID=231269 RepID=A0A366S3I5_9HYPO|nr:uncharacterized protein FIESC28_03807 [Fusarium coffeatum]RBR23428.1 hypothetical protein FIESC28_03807 [Fusarium coffeatum]
MSLPTVYVVAATGTQGSAVCRQLRQLGWTVRATVRNMQSTQAQALANIGVILNSGDWNNQDALAAGLEDCDKLFLVLAPNYTDLDDERVWAQNILSLAKQKGVSDVVYSSSVSADAPEKRTLLSPKHLLPRSLFVKNVIEGLVKRAGFEHWTILRPGFIMTNLLAPKALFYRDLFENNTWLTALTPDTQLNLIDPEDIAKFAVAALHDPAKFHGHGIDLVGERLTAVEMMEALSEVVGREITASFYTEEQIAQDIEKNPFIGASLFLRDGVKHVDAEKVKTWGVPMGTYREFLAREKEAVQKTYN